MGTTQAIEFIRTVYRTIFSVGSDAKTVLGESFGFLTGILYMAPFNLSGKNLCPFASPGCAESCLNTAGRGGMNRNQEARIRKAQWFLKARENFMSHVDWSIRSLVRVAAKRGMTPAVRLNGTTDIAWERIRSADGTTVMERFPDVQFYDYTKAPLSRFRNLPTNYHLTFSRSETNDAQCLEALRAGVNVAVVFDRLPATWHGFTVVNGMDSDLRFLDPKASRGFVVGLTPKGKAKKDTSGFVVRVDSCDASVGEFTEKARKSA